MAKKKQKREIKAHKGGRTETMRMRVTPDEKAAINKAREDKSLSDFVLQLIGYNKED